ncbi:MAG: TolC family protein [Lachnospiraceae bacterium]|nr:TolC family protein [Lachnospiraceae bacterium]
MKQTKLFLMCLLSFTFCHTSFSCTAFADASSQGLYTAVDGNQISPERLQDSLIEYEELGSLIHANNLSIQKLTDSTEETKENYIKIRDSLRSEKADADAAKEEAKEQGDTDSYAEYASYSAIYKAAIQSYNKMIDRLDRYSSNKSRLELEKQLTNGAQSLMISWQSVSLQKETLETQEALYRALYKNAQTQQQAGLATSQEVQTAYLNWQNASISLQSLSDSQAAIYQNLCLMLGVDETGSMQLQNIPAADLDRISQLNLEQDTLTAIGNNSQIKSTRNTSSDGSTSGNASKQRTLSDLENQVTLKMKELYEEVTKAKQSYDAAQAGYASAQITWDNAQKKYSLGMLSKAEYLQQELQFIQKKSSFEAADLSLFQALETYGWAVKGIGSS